jgi:hypothetical protein
LRLPGTDDDERAGVTGCGDQECFMEAGMAMRRTFEAELRFEAPPERVFPLLCPVREYDWIEDWSCAIVFAGTGMAELGGIFTTSLPEVGEEIWTISRYEPTRAIEFVRVAANVRVMKMDFALAAEEPDRTAARFRQTFTALSGAGAAAIEKMTQAEWEPRAKRLETMANHYLTTGAMLRRLEHAHPG